MNAMDVIGYTYDADVHCIDCTQLAADVGILKREPPLVMKTDENGIAQDLVDSEGNPVHPIFGDAEQTEVCGDCGEELNS
jgi:hypothetical protein